MPRTLRQIIGGPGARPLPVHARHVEYSAIASADDEPAKPTDRLIDLALRAADRARGISMSHVTERMPDPPYYPEVWPGEHYKLLAGLMEECRPASVVEIGTSTGLSALAIHRALPSGGRLHTFDIIPWREFSDTALRKEDFADGTMVQVIGDVADPATMRLHAELFRSAEIIFIDGPKDGVFERVVMRRLAEVGLPRNPLLVFDDIRVWNMLAIWREIDMPKLDVTSFGHWSGTGFVEWNRG